MPQPAFSVRPASWTFSRMSSIESVMVPDTVQLIVDVAGLCSRAPALDVMRPAGIAPWRSAHRKRSCQRARDPRPGVVHGRIDRFALLGLEAVFLVPDVQGCRLQGNFRYRPRNLSYPSRTHLVRILRVRSRFLF